MSLIVAVCNEPDIVIAWDKQSRYLPVPGHVFIPPEEEVKKVAKINDQLAIMVAGSYNSDKLRFLADFRVRNARASLDAAFKALLPLGSKMVLKPSERGMMIGLSGYGTDNPTYRFLIREYGDMNLTYVLDYPYNYYLSGEERPIKTAEARIHAEGFDAPLPTVEIETRLRSIVGDCIEQYPEALGGLVEVLRLTLSSTRADAAGHRPD